VKVKIKPLSINQAWQGKRFKTPAYKAYRERLQWLLKPCEIPDGDLYLVIQFGVSNMQSDTDNLIKPFQDALQDRYKFNDRRITALTATKTKTAKGSEFAKWKIYDVTAFNEFMEATDVQCE
jgi:Holliday junction resolvase RusA-like endonuclease